MTDIEFDQIRAGQTVKLHCKGGFTVEGPVDLVRHCGDFAHVRIGKPGENCVRPRSDITRVELLAEPAPKWKGGQLAELTWRDEFGEGTHTAAMAWTGVVWCPLLPGKFVRPEWVVGEPRLMVAVPADSRVVAQDCVVLPPVDPNGCAWQAARLRRYAQSGPFGDEHPYAHDLLLQIADAIEEAQR